MRRRTTILDVLREEVARPSDESERTRLEDSPAAMDEAPAESHDASREDIEEERAPRRRRRRRYEEASADESRAEVRDAGRSARRARADAGEAAEETGGRRRRRRVAESSAPQAASPAEPQAPEQPLRADTTQVPGGEPQLPSSPTSPRRVTRASGRRRGLVMAEWMQRDLSAPRGYFVAAAALLLLMLWGVFLLGQMNGASSGQGPSGSPGVAGGGPHTSPGRMSKSLPTEGVAVTNDAPLRRRLRIGGFSLAKYPATEQNRARVQKLVQHLRAELKPQFQDMVRPLVIRPSDGAAPSHYMLVLWIPAELVGKTQDAEVLFRSALGTVRPLQDGALEVDFAALEPVAIDATRLGR